MDRHMRCSHGQTQSESTHSLVTVSPTLLPRSTTTIYCTDVVAVGQASQILLALTTMPPCTLPVPVPVQIARDKLVSLGTPVGKLTHSGKFRLTIGALDVLSRYAKHKVGSRREGGWHRLRVSPAKLLQTLVVVDVGYCRLQH